MTRAAISRLNNSYHGYFLVVEDGLVARAASQNLGKLAINEVAEVDEAIQSAVDYAGPDALILITDNYSLGRDRAGAARGGGRAAGRAHRGERRRCR